MTRLSLSLSTSIYANSDLRAQTFRAMAVPAFVQDRVSRRGECTARRLMHNHAQPRHIRRPNLDNDSDTETRLLHGVGQALQNPNFGTSDANVWGVSGKSRRRRRRIRPARGDRDVAKESRISDFSGSRAHKDR